MTFETTENLIGLFFLVIRHIGIEVLKSRNEFFQPFNMRFGDIFVRLKIIDLSWPPKTGQVAKRESRP